MSHRINVSTPLLTEITITDTDLTIARFLRFAAAPTRVL